MNDLRDRYLADTVATSTPAQLLVALYDRLLLDLARGAHWLEQGEPVKASTPLVHAQEIVTELMSTLRDDGTWDGAPGLLALYRYLLTRLIQANVEHDPARLAELRALVAPLRDSWAQAAAELAAPPRVVHGDVVA
jgi:flagellar secretion chaperone FliS